jgi:hypothetical protein
MNQITTTPSDRELNVDSIWQHYKGGLYKIVAIGVIDANGDRCVLYSNAENQLFVQTEKRFLGLTGITDNPDDPNILLRFYCRYRFEKV